MEPDFTRQGAFQLDGRWITAIRYKDGTDGVELQFANGRTKLASTRVPPDQLPALLGEANAQRIAQALTEGQTRGTLRGATLDFHRGSLQQVHAQRLQRDGQTVRFADGAPAYEDRGDRLRARTNNAAVAEHLVDEAQAKGWQTVEVRGSDPFRRHVAEAASRAGLQIHGEAPVGSPRSDTPTHWTGQLIEAGPAHYRFDTREGQSYFLRLRTEQGERTLWGVDLERALVESHSHPRVGDLVTVEQRGRQAVTLPIPQRGAQGEWVGQATVRTHRNSWSIETQAYARQRAERAEAFRNGVQAAHELANAEPDLANALASLRLGEQFAERRIEKPEDRERFVQSLKRRLAERLERGEPTPAPRLKQDAQRRLDALASDFDEIAQRQRSATPPTR